MLRAVIAAGMTALALACASAGSIPAVQTEYWKDENFADYERYAWMPSDFHRRAETQPEDHRFHDLIREAIDEQLATTGYARSSMDDADFLVTYHCKIVEKIDRKVIDHAWYETGDRADRRSVRPRVELTSFEEGSIIIDFAKPADGKLVWRGVARGRISPDATPEQTKEIVDRSVRDILGEFPPAL